MFPVVNCVLKLSVYAKEVVTELLSALFVDAVAILRLSSRREQQLLLALSHRFVL